MDKVKELVRQHWDRRAADFDKEASHGLLTDSQAVAWRDLIQRIAGTTPLDALDIGCGTGFLSLLLASAGHRVTGIDLAAAMLEMARRKASTCGLAAEFRDGDAEAPPFPVDSFDLIIERHVLWTLPHPETALKTWRALLRPRGRVVLIEGRWDEMGPRDEYAEMHDQLPLFGGRTEEELVKFVRSCGFATVATSPLMDSALWIEAPSHPRYLITAEA